MNLLRLLLVGLLWAPAAPPAGAEAPPAEAPLDTRFLRDLALTRRFTFGRPEHEHITADGRTVLFLRSGPRSPVLQLFELDVATRGTRVLLTPEQLLKGAEETLSAEERARRERQRVTARGLTTFETTRDGARILVPLSGELYVYHRSDGKIVRLPRSKGTLLDPKLSPDGTSVSYVVDHDVYVMDLATLREHRVTFGGTEDVSHGLAEFVAQEEMGRLTGYWWSPDSQWIAFEEADVREVERWHVSNPGDPGRDPHPQRYPRPGQKNASVRLAVAPARPGGTPPAPVWVDWNRERFPYLAAVTWSEGSPLCILVQDRRQQEMVLLSVDPRTGKTVPLVTETDAAWLNLDEDVPRWLSDGSGFLWTTERTGHRQLEHRDAKGALVRVLVPPTEGYVGGLHVDEVNRQVYFQAGVDPTETHLYRVPLAGGKPTRLTSEPGQHAATFNKHAASKDAALRVVSSKGPRHMPRLTVQRADGTVMADLPSVAEDPPFVPNVEYTTVPVAGLPAGETRELRCSLTRPRTVEPGRRYPVIVEVYAGPTSTMVRQDMSRHLYPQWLADQGFVVVAIDGRGTPRRGREWERAGRGSFGKILLEDQVAGVKALGAKYPELDLERVGITGWSFGGYMSAQAVLRQPDVFKAAVAGAPVTLWEDYDTHYTERYLGLPQENPEGYKESSLLTYAADLRRPLLLVHGTTDDNVFFSHTVKLSDALFRAGRPHELLPLNGFTHMVPDPTVRERLSERTVRFFQKHLHAAGPDAAR